MIGYKDLFDFNNDKDLKQAIKLIKNLDKVYESFISGSKQLRDTYKKNVDDLVKSTKELNESLKKANPSSEQGRKTLTQMSKAAEVASKQYKGLKNNIATVEGTINQLSKEQSNFNQKAKETIKLEQKLNSLNSQGAKENAKLRVQIQEKNKALKQSAKEALGLVSLYQKESQKLVELRKRYKEMALTYGENSKQAKRLRKEAVALDKQLKRLDANVGQYQRSVGLYARAWAGVRKVLTAAGFVGGLYLVVSIFRNAFNAVREFDKEMVNMAAIAGKSRQELKDLEKEIRRVAESSINMANDVAKTATALFTLGKTESEIKDLLEPVNNLSIALQAPADAAGELLIQTLNAFGESSSAAQKYADIIAKMRTSTALDFERIKDALGFLAPTAKAAGVSFEQTGAILGTLVDNGIKAARAGRLMSSAYLRLASRGMTLNDALAELRRLINSNVTETEVLAKANDLFGQRAGALGIILANNTDKINDYTKSFEGANGALEKLTNKQLESLDAKLKILSSAWEEFILRIENGNGSLAKFFSKAIELTTGYIKAFGQLFLSEQELADFRLDKAITGQLTAIREEINSTVQSFKDAGNEVDKALVIEGTIEEQIAKLEKLKKEYVSQLEFQKKVIESGEELDENTQEINTAYEYEINVLNGVINALKEDSKAVREDANATNESTEAIKNNIKEREKLLGKGLKIGKEPITGKPRKEVDSSAIQLPLPQFNKEEFKSNTDKYVEALKAFFKNIEDLDRSHYKKRKEEFDKFANERYIDGATNVYNEALNVTGAFSERRIQNLEEEISAIQAERERELDLAGDNEEAKRAIEDKAFAKEEALRKKQNEARKKQARAEKAFNIIQTLINTYSSAQAALALPPLGLGPIAGIPLAAFITAAGLLRVASIAAQPIPQFAEGTDYAPGGLAIVGEQGREIVHEPKGRTYITGSKSELRDIPEGSQILNNVITERILANDPKEVNDSASETVRSSIVRQRRDNNKEIAKLISINKTDSEGIIKAIKTKEHPDYYRVGTTLYEHKKVSEDYIKRIRKSVIST